MLERVVNESFSGSFKRKLFNSFMIPSLLALFLSCGKKNPVKSVEEPVKEEVKINQPPTMRIISGPSFSEGKGYHKFDFLLDYFRERYS